MSDLDTSFATVGFTTTGFFIPPNVSSSRGIALQPDGKIVMAGSATDNVSVPVFISSYVAVCRYNTNGTLDNSFGTSGLATFLISQTPPSLLTTSLSIQPNGSIVVCGYLIDNTQTFYQLFIVRFTSSGILDTTFASPNGYIFITPAMFTTSYPSNSFTDCYAESIQIDTGINPNKIVIGGYARGVIPPSLVPIYFFALVRLDLNGVLDPTFGVNGLLVNNFTGLDEIGYSLAIGSGKYFLAGRQGINSNISKFAVAKFDNVGTPVLGFGTGGITVIPYFTASSSQEAKSMLVQPDGKIVLAGTYYSNPPFPTSPVPSYALARLDGNNGNLDALFGTSGIVITNLSSINLDLLGNSVAIQSDGKIILGGQYYNVATSTNASFALARYNVNGSLDTTFGINSNGLILEDLVPGTMQEMGYSLAIQPDGRILLGGVKGEFSDISDETEFILARYLSFEPPIPPIPPIPHPVTSICFPAGTPVTTDQGNIPIEDLNPLFHTINSMPIVALTKSYLNEDKFVCIEKHSLEKNIPDKKTYISNNHLILYRHRLIPAKQLVGKFRGVFFVKYHGEIMYNVLMEKHYVIKVNNMSVETLNPKNIVANLYTNKYSPEDKIKLILEINEKSTNNNNNLKKHDYLKSLNHTFTRRKFTILRHSPLLFNLNYRTKKHYMLPHRHHSQTIKNNFSYQRNNPPVKINRSTFRNSSRRR